MINIRQKGADGERKIANDLNEIIWRVLTDKGLEHKYPRVVQRNQNQSTVGGKDLVGAFHLAIEVKCQEQLAINTWWAQCTEQAKRLGEFPVLLYKQNNKGYKAITMAPLWVAEGKYHWCRISMDYEDFLKWFEQIVIHNIENGYQLTE